MLSRFWVFGISILTHGFRRISRASTALSITPLRAPTLRAIVVWLAPVDFISPTQSLTWSVVTALTGQLPHLGRTWTLQADSIEDQADLFIVDCFCLTHSAPTSATRRFPDLGSTYSPCAISRTCSAMKSSASFFRVKPRLVCCLPPGSRQTTRHFTRSFAGPVFTSYL